MLIFFTTFESGGSLGILIRVALFAFVILSQSSIVPGFLPTPWGVFSGVVSGFNSVVEGRGGKGGLSLTNLFSLLVGLVLLGLAFRSFMRQVREQGFSQTLRSSFASNSFQRSGSGSQRSRSLRRRQSQKDRRDAVERAIHKLPVEVFTPKDELESLTVSELKYKAREMKVDLTGCMEKKDLVARLVAEGGTSGASCSICCDDYLAGDGMRVLSCGHRFHVECVDKWFLTSTSYSRGPACPMCNAPLPLA